MLEFIIMYIDYTELGRIIVLMILDEVCYPVILFCGVILSRMVQPSSVQSVSDVYLGWYARPLCLPSCSDTNINSSCHLFKALDLPSGEGALTH